MFKKHNREDNTDRFSEIAKKFGEKDIRFGQAIYNYTRKLTEEGKDLYFIENDDFEAGLLKELENYSDK